MKTIRLTAGCIALVCILLAACTPQSHQMETVNHRFSDTIPLAQGLPYCLIVDFDIDFPASGPNEDALQTIQRSLLSTLFDDNYTNLPIEEAILQYKNDLSIEYRLDNEPLLSELEDDETLHSMLHNEHTLKGYVMFDSDRIFSYAVERFVYMGGAHGITTRMFCNFDKETGRMLHEEDLFAGDQTAELTNLLIQNLIRQESVQSVDDLEAASYYVASIKPNNNFYISDEGINYVFNPYEIAPYYMGETTVLIPAGDLKTILHPSLKIF